jgi:hypothetical protein
LTGCISEGKLQNAEQITNKDVVSIKLECVQACKEMKEIPFLQKSFEDKESIEKFTNAINMAEKIEAALDYSAMFMMEIIFTDGTIKGYHLNIINKDKVTGLLVEPPGSSIGYRIPENLCNELRKIIYN